MFIISLDNEVQISKDLIKENGFTLKTEQNKTKQKQ